MSIRKGLTAVLLTSGAVVALALPTAASASAAPAMRTVSATAVTQSPAAVTCNFYSGTANTVYGNTGDRVRQVQCLLVFWGYWIGNSGPYGNGIDGEFGTNTRNAVLQFQRDSNSFCAIKLSVDGEVGTHTWSALRNVGGLGCPTV